MLLYRLFNTGHVCKCALLPHLVKCNGVRHMDIVKGLCCFFHISFCIPWYVFAVISLVQFRIQKPIQHSTLSYKRESRMAFLVCCVRLSMVDASFDGISEPKNAVIFGRNVVSILICG